MRTGEDNDSAEARTNVDADSPALFFQNRTIVLVDPGPRLGIT